MSSSISFAEEFRDRVESFLKSDDVMLSILGMPSVGKTAVAKDYVKKIGSKHAVIYSIAPARPTVRNTLINLLKAINEELGVKYQNGYTAYKVQNVALQALMIFQVNMIIIDDAQRLEHDINTIEEVLQLLYIIAERTGIKIVLLGTQETTKLMVPDMIWRHMRRIRHENVSN